MRLGFLTVPFLDRPLEAVLDLAVELGVDAVELPAGGVFGVGHINPEFLLGDEDGIKDLKESVHSRDLAISAFALHGNPVSPSDDECRAYKRQFESLCKVAELLAVRRFTLLSGLPAGSPTDRVPNWITSPFPFELAEALAWQWNEVLLPHWEDAARFAADHGVELCFEMVPGDCVHSPKTFLRLKENVSTQVFCNLDPSHFLHQGIDPVAAIDVLAGSIGHVHAKDAAIHPKAAASAGMLDTEPLFAVERRSWAYRTIGWGHDEHYWRRFLSALRMAGYDGDVSIEHEDVLLSREEGLRQAVGVLSRILPRAPGEREWWPSD